MKPATPFTEPISGKYLNLSVGGRQHRIYVEEAGQGIPLLCLHTAGADSRQYRGVLNDPEILQRFRVIAFDLPWHGKSSPPEGWQTEQYKLTSADYIDTILSVCEGLQLKRPLVMGCSIGGRVVLHLAMEHPDRFCGAIGLQSGAHVDPYYDLDWLHRNDVNGGEICGAIVSGLIGPTSPEVHRWETLWHYMQGGPGVFKGDVHFYTADGDIRHRLKEINTENIPLWLLTGEYDYSCTPEDTQYLGDTIPGVRLQIMKGMGHFPMSEDPVSFLQYLRPILSEVIQLAN